MPKSRPPYPAAFRQQMVELVRSGRTPGHLAREFEPSAEAIRNWVAQADRDAGKRSDGLRTEEHEEIRRLRRENRRLREEREILAKATAWFARETGPGEVYRFMSTNQARFRVATMARVLGVSTSGYYAWPQRPCGAAVRTSDSSGTAEQAWSPVGEPWSSNPDAPKALGREPVAPADEGSPGGSRRHDGVDAPAGSRPRLPAAAQGSGRRLVRLYTAGARPNRESTARRTRSGRRCRSGATPGAPSTSPARTFASSTGTSRFRGAIARARRRRRAFGRAWSGRPLSLKPGGGQMR